MKITDKDELFDRESAQGSVYDKMYFTDDQLKQGAEINQRAAAGEISWDSAHNWWENTRSGYGYSGGEDGHGYTTLANKAKESSPSYINQYQGAINQAANALLNRKAFTYDHNTDPMYQQYADSYTRQGKQAMDDTLAKVSARTGGLASSYAGTAAQQTYNNYMSALADKVPELRQLAYQMYMDEGDTMRQNLQMLQGLEQTDYNRYLDALGQWNDNRQFDYDAKQDEKKWKWDEENQTYDRNKEATKQAQEQVADYFAMGGKLDNIAEVLGEDILDVSGYTQGMLALMESAYAPEEEDTPRVPDGTTPVIDPLPTPRYVGSTIGVPEKSDELYTDSGKQIDPAVVDYFNELLEGGIDSESLEQILDGWIATGYRGVTKEDVDRLLESAGGNWGH